MQFNGVGISERFRFGGINISARCDEVRKYVDKASLRRFYFMARQWCGDHAKCSGPLWFVAIMLNAILPWFWRFLHRWFQVMCKGGIGGSCRYNLGWFNRIAVYASG